MAVALIEALLSGFWAPFYFRWGIPVFSRTLLYTGGGHGPIDPDVLSKACARRILPSIVFHGIGPEEIAFRERLLQLTLLTYTPVMHGLIRFDESNRTVIVTGHANAFPLCFLAMAVVFCLSGPAVGGFKVFFLVPVVLVLGVLYAVQARRFNGICKLVEEQLNAA